QSRYRNLYQDLTEAPAFLRYLERHMLGEIEPDETVDARFTRWLELYREYLPLRQMLQIGPRFGDLPEGGVDLYLYLTATTDEGRQDEDEKSRTERWWRDLLSRDGARIERAATALKQADAATADTIRQRLTAALERRDGLAYGWEEFVSMGQALARLGDGRDLSQMASVPLGEYPVGPEGQVESAPGFSIGKYLVANGQYQAFIDEHPDHLPPTDWDPETRQHPAGKSNYPVVYVSYEDAVAYAQWRNKRLPEQREWEAAAQGQAGQEYPYGNKLRSEAANMARLGLGGATPVGAFPEDVSPVGLLDMTGNVSEWTQTEAGDVDGEQAYVVKGGNWQLSMSLAQNDADTFQRVRKTQKSAAIGFR
ncbi:MAG: formylglycine-generating enzyme family protein, partial [Chloroflexi bacterium]|nr:formylglycine-generating enzyme family protein [Chloroflexota bacterium]